jgi:transcription antitermination factor NusB
MTRHELREYIFKIVFQIPFYGPEGMDEQTAVDIEGLKMLIEEPLEDEDKIKLSEKDEEYIVSKVKGIVTNVKEIDEVLRAHSRNWDLDRIGKEELAILRLAAYEILYDEDIPNVVAVNEAVEIAKTYSGEKSSCFINGVLAGLINEDNS